MLDTDVRPRPGEQVRRVVSRLRQSTSFWSARRASLAFRCVCGVFALFGAASCAVSPSYADLARLGRDVPRPPSTVFVSANDFTNDSVGRSTKEVNLTYSNKTLTCAQLHAAWIAALRRAHRGFDASPPGDAQIYLKDRAVFISVDLGDCAQPQVDTSEKQSLVPAYLLYAHPLWTLASLIAVAACTTWGTWWLVRSRKSRTRTQYQANHDC